MKVCFRRVSKRDLRRLNEIVSDPKVSRFLNLILPVSMKSTREFFEECRKKRSMLYCIIVDGMIAGSVCITPRKKDAKQAHVGEFGISIAREFWSRGVGGKAIDFILKEARKRKIRRVEFEVVADNARARKLYEKHGFRVEGRKKRSFKIGRKYHDTIVMGRWLR